MKLKNIKKWKKIFLLKNKYRTNKRNLFYNLAYNYLPNNRNVSIVDIGCKNNLFISYIKLNMNYKNIFLLDKNPLDKNTIYYKAPENLPFNDYSIDYIHCSHLIEHLSYIELLRFLKEINRVLNINGILIISTPLLWNIFYNDIDHIKPYNPSIFINQLTNYKVLKLVYRYNHLDSFSEGLGSEIKTIDFIIQVFRKILLKLKIHNYKKNGYTLILKK